MNYILTKKEKVFVGIGLALLIIGAFTISGMYDGELLRAGLIH